MENLMKTVKTVLGNKSRNTEGIQLAFFEKLIDVPVPDEPSPVPEPPKEPPELPDHHKPKRPEKPGPDFYPNPDIPPEPLPAWE